MKGTAKEWTRSIARRAAGIGQLENGLSRLRDRLAGVDKRQRLHDSRLKEFGQRLQRIEQRLQSLGDQVQDIVRAQAHKKRTLASNVDSALTRLDALEEEIQENRQLNRRIAELTDLVGQVLLPSADRDEDSLHQRLMAYNEHLSR